MSGEGAQDGRERRWGEQSKSESWGAGVMQVEGDEENLSQRQPTHGLAEITIVTTHPNEGHTHSEHLTYVSSSVLPSPSVLGR